MRDECLSSRSAFPVVSPPKDGGVQCLGARCVCLDDDLARMRSLLVGVFAPLSLSLSVLGGTVATDSPISLSISPPFFLSFRSVFGLLWRNRLPIDTAID